jgi:c-di-GMP-binding flagellar brake protein YcgR
MKSAEKATPELRRNLCDSAALAMNAFSPPPMPSPESQLLTAAIERNSALVISLPSAGILRNYKSRFLGSHPEGFWIEAASEEKPLIEELLRSGQSVGIAFRSGPNKVLFAVPIKEYNPLLQVNAETQTPAMLLPIPAELKTIQRRTNYRVAITPDADLSVRMWKLAEHTHLNDRPLPSQEIKAELRDISLGGLGVFLRSRTGGDPQVIAGQRVRTELKFGEVILLLDGRIREGTEANATGMRTGVAFKTLDNQLEGRQKLAQLARLVGDLQRDEVKRLRRAAS